MIQPKLPGCDILQHKPIPANWRPDEIPSLKGIHSIRFDTETTGLKWYRGDLPIGIAIATDRNNGKLRRYLPWGHRPGGNHPEERMKEWAKCELVDKEIVGLNIRFDIHQMREWGVDLEAQGCTFRDVGHDAALLDDNRRGFSLEAISQDYLGIGKIPGLDGEYMADYHAYEVTEYGRRDVELVDLLVEAMDPKLEAEGLLNVCSLENSVIPVVCEMERNACLLDVEKLNRWVIESEREVSKLHNELIKIVGFSCDPGKNGDLQRLFEREKIPVTKFSEKTGNPSFDSEVMAHAAKLNPIIDLAYTINKINSLRSKYLVCYQRCVDHKGLIRTSFHQLRADDGGTISGRFSSSAPNRNDPTSGINAQQIFATEKQIKMLGDRWIIRELYVPVNGKLFYGSDAEQIEFRLFAHYSGSPKLIEAYKVDPLTDFHSIVRDIICQVRPGTTRKLAKDCNFAKIYGAGQSKVAEMLGMSEEEAGPFVETYDKAFPEAAMLMKKAMDAARQRGWVKTLSGRRARFPERQFLHSALNRVIQGTAADLNKKKLVELHNARKRTGFVMRATVHDEVVGDVPDLESARMVDEILAAQTTPLSVPILWGGKTGANWRECK